MICVPGALVAICQYPVWNPILQVFDETELRLQDYTLPFSFNTANVNYCQVLMLQKIDNSLKTSLIENVFRKLEEGGLTMKMRCGKVWNVYKVKKISQFQSFALCYGVAFGEQHNQVNWGIT